MVTPSIIGLVDFSHGLTVQHKATASDDAPSAAGQRFIAQLSEFRQMCAGTVVLCLDQGPYWRKLIYSDYKGGREREPEYAAIYSWTLERARADGYQIAKAPAEEGDDIISTLVREYEDEGCGDIRIFGADKDCCQCLSSSTRMFVPKGKGEFEIRDPDWVLKKYGVDPKDMALFQAICGDPSDRIPGIKGIGEVGAAKLINAYHDPAGMAKACAAQVEASKMTGKLAAFWKNYAAGMAELPKWLKLTTLNDRAALELHPLKYLERLPVQKLVDDGEMSDADDSSFGPEDFPGDEYAANGPSAAELEEERRTMAASLPVDPPKPEPRIGKDPNADKALKDAAADRLATANTNAPKTPERVAETRARIEAGNAAEKERTPKPNATLSDGGKALHEGKGSIDDLYDRHGQLRPDPTVMDPPRPKDPTASSPTAGGSQATTGSAEVVPKTQGPQPERLAMVPVAPPSWELATQPRSPSEMSIVAGKFWNSRFYAAHGNADGTFAVIALGRELGLGAAASVEGFHIVNQRPFAKAVMLKALAERDPNCEWIMVTSADAKHATIKTKHRKLPEVLEYTYTIERAAAAGYLTGKNADNWKTKTQEMLEARATSKGVRRWYPGATFGMHAVEEANDD